MATWTRIPETKIASTLGGAIGKAAGTVTKVANKTLDAVELQIEVLQRSNDDNRKQVRIIQESAQQQVQDSESKSSAQTATLGGGAYSKFLGKTTENSGSPESIVNSVSTNIQSILSDAQAQIEAIVSKNNRDTQKSLREIDQTLKAVEVSLKTCLTPLSTARTLCKTLKAPLTALKAAIQVIKLLPLPQIYLVVAFTTVESDLLEMLTELVKQAEEEVSGLETIIKTLEQTLQPIIDRIERIRAKIALLGTESELACASAEDRDVLGEAGLLDESSGDSIFSAIQGGLSGGGVSLPGGGSCIPYGLDTGSLDLSDPEISNQLALKNPGDKIEIQVSGSTGTRIETWYSSETDKPEIPGGFYRGSGSWTQNPEGAKWQFEAKVTGTGKAYSIGEVGEFVPTNEISGSSSSSSDSGSSSSSSTVTGSTGNSSSTDSSLFGITQEINILGKDNYGDRPGILKIEDWSSFLEDVLSKLRNLPLSQDMKDQLDSYWNYQVTSLGRSDETDESSADTSNTRTITSGGETYTVEVVEDEHSPRVAIRRYAQVRDSQGVVVLSGIKTFSTNLDTLVQEIKMQLDQLTR